MGFGISTPEQARRVSSVADGIIVGSRIIQLIEEDASLAKLRAFIGRLREAVQTNKGVIDDAVCNTRRSERNQQKEEK
ncbi:tryptophan synthase subunit alpha [Dehalococcoidia bacterium]|nr:tryptophan synthase subunit alpha [Dehalococcoidia bacterium]MCL0087482.1 tryptophan synthase subunit alpha [Dehalococcoidia bacterium]